MGNTTNKAKATKQEQTVAKVKQDLRTADTVKAINGIMATMDNADPHYGKGDTDRALACNRFFADLVTMRAEAYVMATQIDIYAGSRTALYDYITKQDGIKSKVYSKECVAHLKSVDEVKALIEGYNEHMKQEQEQATKQEQAKPKATKQGKAKPKAKPKAKAKDNAGEAVKVG